MSLLLQLFFFNNKNDAQQKILNWPYNHFAIFFLETAVTSVIRPVGVFSCRWRLAVKDEELMEASVLQCSWGVFIRLFVTAEKVKQKAMRFLWLVNFSTGIFGLSSFFSYIFPPMESYGGVSRVC